MGGPVFTRFLTFHPFSDKNSIVGSYFVVEKRVFVEIYKKKGLGLWRHNRKKETIELRI